MSDNRKAPEEEKLDAHGRALLSLQAIHYLLGRMTTTSVELRFIKGNMLKNGDDKQKEFARTGLTTLEDVIEESAKKLHEVAEYLGDVWNETDMHGNSKEDVVLEVIFDLLNGREVPRP